MREHLSRNIAHLKANSVRNSINKFVNAGLSLGDVRSTAINLTSKMLPGSARDKARKTIEKTVMKTKLEQKSCLSLNQINWSLVHSSI